MQAMRGQPRERRERMARAARLSEGHLEEILDFRTKGSADRLHWGTQQPAFSREAQSSLVADGGIHDCHAQLRRRKTHPPVLLTQ